MNKTIDLFNELTANLGVLYIKLHQHHFYVKGHHFFILHEKFEDFYNDVHSQLDEIAERVLMLGGKPVSTLGEFLALSTIKETPYTREKSGHEMVEETIKDFEIIVSLLQKGLDDEDMDKVSEDILIGTKAEYDKHLWMLRSFNAK